jgi:hypothetical protein
LEAPKNKRRSLIGFLDFGRLGKLMSRTESDHEHEALLAMRQANALLRKTGSSWPEILLRVIMTERKMEEKPPEANLDPLAILEQTLRWLLDNGKITAEEHVQLLNMVRQMFQSKDTNFKRRVTRRVKNLMKRMKVTKAGKGERAPDLKSPFPGG